MPNTVEYYLSKGCDRTMAEYYASGRKKVLSVKPNEDFTLFLTFSNGEKRILDVKPLLDKGGVFTTFRDYSNFKVDICSDSCYVDSVPVGQ